MLSLFGLIARVSSSTAPSPLPLQSISVSAIVVDFVTEVTLRQTYFVAGCATLAEATYAFPLDSNSAVSSLTLQTPEGLCIVGKVKELEQARKEYHKACKEGFHAALLTEFRKDVFEMKLGNIPPSEKVEVELKYVAELKPFGKYVRFLLPTHIAPRYVPAGMGNGELPEVKSSPVGGLNVSVNILKGSEIVSVYSPSHKSKVLQERRNQGDAEDCVRVGLKLSEAAMDGDFVLDIEMKEPHKPKICMEHDQGKGKRVIMLSMYPRYQLAGEQSPYSWIFVLDRSGSMNGEKIKQACSALQLFLRSIPEGSFFNIVSFGSKFSCLFEVCKLYDQYSLSLASEHVSQITANYGSTELYAPLNHILHQPRIMTSPRRKIFLLTDGQISNSEQVLSLVREGVTRMDELYTFGIGDGVSHFLVEGLARVGRGTSVFVAGDQAGQISEAVASQLKQALQPRLDNVKVAWEYPKGRNLNIKDEEKEITPQSGKVKSLLGYISPEAPPPQTLLPNVSEDAKQAPLRIPPIFNEERFILYRLLDKNDAIPTAVRISADTPADGALETNLSLKEQEIVHGNIIHRLAARKLIEELEIAMPSAARERILELALEHGLSSKHTSFVAVNRSTRRVVGVLDPGFSGAYEGAGGRRAYGASLDRQDKLVGARRAAGERARRQESGMLPVLGHSPASAQGRNLFDGKVPAFGGEKSLFGEPMSDDSKGNEKLAASTLFGGGGGFGFASAPASGHTEPISGSLFGSIPMDDHIEASKDSWTPTLAWSMVDNTTKRHKKSVERAASSNPHPLHTFCEIPKLDQYEKGAHSQQAVLDELVLLQSYDGSFDWNEGLVSVLSCIKKSWQLSENIPETVDKSLFATLVVLSILCKFLPNLKTQWELIYQKATAFVGKKAKTGAEKERASKLVASLEPSSELGSDLDVNK